ncbi:hypothetical protein [Apilactobacillus xinyiensis]|uniref:hypothetical protein n=1 Tax=Apilactobacillus xinyiensis TaxID=2841032 RepID=UPI001C7DB6EE|nr:hypothetical protein [Apilactobacillus xinyiensis]
MPFIKKCSISFIYLVAAFLTISVITSCMDAIRADAKTITLPAKYRHDWHATRKFKGSKEKAHYIYKLRKNYGYFNDYDGSNKNLKSKYIKYKYVRKENGIYYVKPVNGSYESTNFETKGNHITIHYDVARINLYR